MKRILTIMAATAFFFACQESIEERAAREARETTETKCPMPLGDYLFLDSVVFDIPTLTQTQYFRVTGELDDDSLFMNVNGKALLLEELRNTPSYKVLMERKVAFHYVYRSTQTPDKVLLEVTLTAEDYQ